MVFIISLTRVAYNTKQPEKNYQVNYTHTFTLYIDTHQHIYVSTFHETGTHLVRYNIDRKNVQYQPSECQS